MAKWFSIVCTFQNVVPSVWDKIISSIFEQELQYLLTLVSFLSK